jgi:hypothetical protein
MSLSNTLCICMDVFERLALRKIIDITDVFVNNDLT